VIALASGAYDEAVRLRAGVTLWGACVAQTSVEPTALDDLAGAITVTGRGASVRNLRISGERAGVWVDAQSVTLDDVEISSASRFGILVAFGGELTGDHVLVRGTRPRDGRLGVGIYVSDAGHATLAHAAIEQSTELGVLATGDGSVLRLTSSSVVDTRAQTGGSFGRGVFARAGGRVELDTAVVESSREDGLLAEGAGSSMDLASVLVRDTRARERDGVAGRALEVTQGATVDARGLVAIGNRELTLFVHDDGSELVLTDAVVHATLPGADGHDGDGLLVEGGAHASLERAVVSESASVGLLVRGAGSTLTMSDVRVQDGLGDTVDGASGHALEVSGGASVDGTRIAFERCRQSGVLAFDAGTRVLLSELAVRDTLARLCATGACADAAGGVGVAAVRGATVRLERFAVVRAAASAAQLVGDAMLELVTGELAESPIGLNVQAPDADIRALTAAVTFRDNVRNLDTATLPVPDPAL